MQNTDLVTDKTFFIMKDGDVKTYYKTQVIDGQLQVLVYDRNSITGFSPLNTQEVKTILTEYSNEYCERLKEFIIFLYHDLLHKENKPLLYEYIAHIWNGNDEKAWECYEEDCSLPEQFVAYMQELISCGVADPDIVAFFNVIYCEQEVTYPKYSQKWLEENYLIAKH